jgi:hypothetical protein
VVLVVVRPGLWREKKRSCIGERARQTKAEIKAKLGE